LRFPRLRIAGHSRRIRRHPWQGQSDGVGVLGEEAENGAGRDVPFDHVPIDQGRVTRQGTLRNAVFCPELCQLWIFSEIDIGSKIL